MFYIQMQPPRDVSSVACPFECRYFHGCPPGPPSCPLFESDQQKSGGGITSPSLSWLCRLVISVYEVRATLQGNQRLTPAFWAETPHRDKDLDLSGAAIRVMERKACR